MIEEIPLSEGQRAALEHGRRHAGMLPADLDHRTRGALERKNLIRRGQGGAWHWTDAGRRCVQWFAEDCAEHWNVSPSTFNKYVGRGTAPEPTYPGTQKSTVDRAWWDPATVRAFVRPGSLAGPASQRVQLDNAEVLRAWRAGQRTDPPMSIAALAARFSISPTTASALLERMGEKPATSASLRAGNGPNARVTS